MKRKFFCILLLLLLFGLISGKDSIFAKSFYKEQGNNLAVPSKIKEMVQEISVLDEKSCLKIVPGLRSAFSEANTPRTSLEGPLSFSLQNPSRTTSPLASGTASGTSTPKKQHVPPSPKSLRGLIRRLSHAPEPLSPSVNSDPDYLLIQELIKFNPFQHNIDDIFFKKVEASKKKNKTNRKDDKITITTITGAKKELYQWNNKDMGLFALLIVLDQMLRFHNEDNLSLLRTGRGNGFGALNDFFQSSILQYLVRDLLKVQDLKKGDFSYVGSKKMDTDIADKKMGNLREKFNYIAYDFDVLYHPLIGISNQSSIKDVFVKMIPYLLKGAAAYLPVYYDSKKNREYTAKNWTYCHKMVFHFISILPSDFTFSVVLNEWIRLREEFKENEAMLFVLDNNFNGLFFKDDSSKRFFCVKLVEQLDDFDEISKEHVMSLLLGYFFKSNFYELSENPSVDNKKTKKNSKKQIASSPDFSKIIYDKFKKVNFENLFSIAFERWFLLKAEKKNHEYECERYDNNFTKLFINSDVELENQIRFLNMLIEKKKKLEDEDNEHLDVYIKQLIEENKSIFAEDFKFYSRQANGHGRNPSVTSSDAASSVDAYFLTRARTIEEIVELEEILKGVEIENSDDIVIQFSERINGPIAYNKGNVIYVAYALKDLTSKNRARIIKHEIFQIGLKKLPYYIDKHEDRDLWVEEWALLEFVNDFTDLLDIEAFIQELKTCVDLEGSHKDEFDRFIWLMKFIFEQKQKNSKKFDQKQRFINNFNVSPKDNTIFNDNLSYLVNA